MVDNGGPLEDQLCGMGEESIRGCGFPLRVSWREMLTDVAKPCCPEQCVRDRMKHHVRIAMPLEAARMGYFNSAEHDRTFALESVHIEAHSSSRYHSRGEDGFRQAPIGLCGQLLQQRIAFDRRHLQSRCKHHRRFIRSRSATRFLVSIDKVFHVKCLRRLNAQEILAVDGGV